MVLIAQVNVCPASPPSWGLGSSGRRPGCLWGSSEPSPTPRSPVTPPKQFGCLGRPTLLRARARARWRARPLAPRRGGLRGGAVPPGGAGPLLQEELQGSRGAAPKVVVDWPLGSAWFMILTQRGEQKPQVSVLYGPYTWRDTPLLVNWG